MSGLRISVDYAVNAAYITLRPEAVARTVEVTSDVFVDLDALNVVDRKSVV